MPATQVAKPKKDPFKQGTRVKWTRKDGSPATGVVRGREQMANGVWLRIRVEGQSDLSKVRIGQARLA